MGGKNPQYVGEVHSLSGRLVIDSAGNILPPIAGNGRVFYVNSVNGNNAFDGRSALTAKATLANIAGDLAANDIVYIAPAHAETVSAAGQITIAASNVRIYGMGSENEKPVFTFSTVAATFAVTGNNVALVNIAGTTSIDSNTNPFNITGDDFWGDLEWRDSTAAIEALRAVRLDTANRCYLKLKYNGFTGGDATVNAVRLDDCDHVRIDIDAFGRVDATGWVEFVDVASINVYVKGYFFTQGITTLARNVVDTVTGSSWYVDGYDGSAGAPFNGGSGNAIAAGDLSVIATDTTTIRAELSGAAGIATFPAAAAPANAVSIAEVEREIYDQSDKAVTNTTATLVNATTIFTIAGGPIEILSLVARCVTLNDATASTLQWSADPTDGVAATFSAASASLANAAAGAMVVLQGTGLATAPIVNASGVGLGQTVTNGIVVGAGIITTTIGVGSTTGTWQHHMRYRPLSRGVVVS